MPSVKLPPECAARAGDAERHEHAALAPGHHVAGDAARLGVEHDAGAARLRLDHRAAFRAADLLVAGEQPEHRRRRAAELRERGEHEAVHHQPRLHVGDARPVGDAVADGERPARHLAIGEDRVAMAHQHDVAAGVARGAVPRHGRTQAVAVLLLVERLHGDVVRGHEALDHRADRVDAGLVVAAAVDVHHLAQQRHHRVLLAGEPGGDLGFGRHVHSPGCRCARMHRRQCLRRHPGMTKSAASGYHHHTPTLNETGRERATNRSQPCACRPRR